MAEVTAPVVPSPGAGALAGTMRYRVNAIFALHSQRGLIFGCTREVDGDQMVFQASGDFSPGETLDWRMQLVGRREMVVGTLRVDGRRPAVGDESPLFEGTITAISSQNRAQLESWLAERSSSNSQSAQPQPKPKREAAQATQPLPTRGRTRSQPSSGSLPSARPSPAPAGREAISAALKSSLARTRRLPLPAQRPLTRPQAREEGEDLRAAIDDLSPPLDERELGAPSPSGLLDPPRSSPPGPAHPKPPSRPAGHPYTAPARPPEPEAPRPAERAQGLDDSAGGGPAPRPTRDPTLAFRPGSDPLQLKLTWTGMEAFQRDYDRHLKNAGLFVPLTTASALRTRGAPLLVRLVLPSGARLNCRATVVAPMSSGAGVSLQLSPEQRETLANEAGDSEED